jgi:hydrogenase maturation protease
VNGKILVACIGNIFFGDDAFGVEVAKRLAQSRLPEAVSVVDFGIRSYDLAYALMEEWDLVILVDALHEGGTPGTLYVFEPDLSMHDEVSLDPHTLDPSSVLQLVQTLGGKTGPLLLVGCEPKTLDPNSNGAAGLSAPVCAAVDEAVRMIQGLITRARNRAIAA